MVKNKTKDPEPKSLPQIMQAAGAVISLTIRDGFANISFDAKNDMRVQFLNDEGYTLEESDASADDIIKVATFIKEIKSVRLQDYAKTV